MANGQWKVQGVRVMFCIALAMAKDLHTRCPVGCNMANWLPRSPSSVRSVRSKNHGFP